jgi:hypothetical protein
MCFRIPDENPESLPFPQFGWRCVKLLSFLLCHGCTVSSGKVSSLCAFAGVKRIETLKLHRDIVTPELAGEPLEICALSRRMRES